MRASLLCLSPPHSSVATTPRRLPRHFTTRKRTRLSHVRTFSFPRRVLLHNLLTCLGSALIHLNLQVGVHDHHEERLHDEEHGGEENDDVAELEGDDDVGGDFVLGGGLEEDEDAEGDEA